MKTAKKSKRVSGKAAPRCSQFPDRIVLSVGFPWAMGTGPYTEIAMRETVVGGRNKRMKWPRSLWLSSCPRYRLVLEKLSTANMDITDNARNQD